MISQEEYQRRRSMIAQIMPENAIALIPAGQEYLRNGDSHYAFRQDSDFYYLTGFNEPDALLLIKSGASDNSILFNRPRNPDEERWTGKRLGQAGAIEVLGMKESWPIESWPEKLPEILSDTAVIYFNLSHNSRLDNQIMQALKSVKQMVRRGAEPPRTLQDLSPILSEMRLFKSDDEIGLMKKAAEISAKAHRRAMKACKERHFEYQLEAELRYEFMKHGCRSAAYEPIVGAGANGCILHYIDNNQALKPGELVLIDAGCELDGYAADISRTFPVNGKFSAEQKAIYELVLSAQQAAIAKVTPGTPWNHLQETIVKILTEGLCELGLLKGDVNALIEQGAYRKYYMHNSGHWLGLDVHDCGAYKKNNHWRHLEAGMVLTVEPGLYISGQDESIDPRWWDIGIRIEDDILVTSSGHENMTKAAPVTIQEIEALMRE